MTGLADRIATEGSKLTLYTARGGTLANTGIKRGPSGEGQPSVNAWFAYLLALKRQEPMPDVPPALSELFSSVWTSALKAAKSTLTVEKHTLNNEMTPEQCMVAHPETIMQRLVA